MSDIATREISDRLEEAVRERVAFADRLKPALALACRQLEGLCPAVMGATRRGVVATLATPLPRGTWLIVLANARKVLTFHMLAPPAGLTRLEVIDHYATGVAEAWGQAPSPSDVLTTIRLACDKHGGPPGKPSPDVDQRVGLQILGLLFGAASPQERADLVNGVETVIAANVCPLHVGLIGKGSLPGTTCGVWPLGLPFAPYVDSLGLDEP